MKVSDDSAGPYLLTPPIHAPIREREREIFQIPKCKFPSNPISAQRVLCFSMRRAGAAGTVIEFNFNILVDPNPTTHTVLCIRSRTAVCPNSPSLRDL